MSKEAFDVLIIGGGMAGASAAYFLTQAGLTVCVLERENQPGYHSTGRSAALFSETYGPPAIRKLSTASRPFLESPPDGFSDYPILSSRGVLTLAADDDLAALDQLIEESQANGAHIERLDAESLRRRVPILREGAFAAGMLERDAMDMDVHALHQGFLRGFRKAGGEIVLNAEVARIARSGGHWTVTTGKGVEVSASVLVNAAGAWADEIATLADVSTIGLVPKRRSAVMIDLPDGVDGEDWPLVVGVREDFYFKPDAGRLLLSPADATPVAPQDVQPEDLDIAIAIDRLMTVTELEVGRPGESWAGLRSFVGDGSPVVGYAPDIAGFFWLAGQGGYGIQTAPAMGELAAALVQDRAVPEGLSGLGFSADMVSPTRPSLFAGDT